MKNRCVLFLVWSLCFTAFGSFAQSSVSSPPLVVAVTNISSASVHVWTNGAVSFHFTRGEVASTEDVIRDGVRKRRLVMIMDGEHLLAEARLVGMARGTAGRSAVAVHAVSRRWLSFFR